MAIWEQFAVPYFFAVNFAPQYLMGGAGGKFSMLPAMSPMVGGLVVHYPYQRPARQKRRICFGRDICLVRGANVLF